LSERRDFGLKNPFELATALKLAALIAAIGLVANIFAAQIGDRGVFAVAALSGLADVDAVTLSIARMSSARIADDAATLAILVAVAANTASKSAMAAYLGGLAFGWLVSLVNIVVIAAMFAGYLFLPSAVMPWL
jgi:uncharacterized membrane protein (DUF4010 family)